MDRPRRLIPTRLRALRDATRDLRDANAARNLPEGVEGPAAPARRSRAAAVLVAGACLVAITAVVVVLAGGGGSEKAPRQSAAQRHVSDCALNHGLPQAAVKRPTRPGESPVAPPAAPRFAAFPQETYLSCDWPPPPGAFADGYRVITATTVAGPGRTEASGSNYADRIESRCRVLVLEYRLTWMNQSRPLEPFEAPVGAVVRWGGARWSGGGDGEARRLPFRPSYGELVVVHNGLNRLDQVRCAS